MATDDSWMPAHGRHPVSIGSSLGRALKARKGATVTKRSNLPDRDFYSFRYNFKPESIDATKPGTIEVKRGPDSTVVTVERSSSQAGESLVFAGPEQPAKEWECVLIYDEEMGTFTLEKLDSFLNLQYRGRSATTTLNQSSGSPLPRPTPPKEPIHDLEEQLELDLGVEDAEGEPDEEFEEIAPSISARKEEEEEEEEEIPIAVQKAPPAPPKPKAPQRAPKPPAKPEAPPPKSKVTQGKGKGKPKREHSTLAVDTSNVEEEHLEFGRPARPTKRSRPSPPSAGLALPGAFPDPLAHTSQSKSTPASRPIVRQTSPPVVEKAAASDSEEDWDEVAAAVPVSSVERPRVDDEDAEGEDEEEIDMNAFEAEMNQHLEESDEDFLAAVVSPEPEPPSGGRPISLNQFAGGEPSQDEDDYSSSEDSDDD